LSENVVHDVLAHYFVYDVMAFNNYWMQNGEFSIPHWALKVI